MSSRGRAEGVVLRAAQCAMSRDLASREHPGPVCPVCQARIRYGDQMTTGRMEAFSDGVIAILITVMVLELPIPHGTTWAALRPAAPVLLTYLMSFAYLGIYWNNHHHMLQATTRVSGLILWANLHLLFWLSLIPFTTEWLGGNHFAATPAAGYGIVLLAAALAYYGLQTVIIRDQGSRSVVAAAAGRRRQRETVAAAVRRGHRAVLRQPLARCGHLRRRRGDVDDPRPAPGTHHHQHSRHQPGPGPRITVISWWQHPRLRHGSEALSRRSARASGRLARIKWAAEVDLLRRRPRA